MSEPREISSHRTPPPWSMILVTLVAFTVFILNRRLIALPLALMASVVVSQLTGIYFRRGSAQHWCLRALLYVAVFAYVLSEELLWVSPVTIAGQWIDAAMQICMAELAIQFWQWPRTGGEHSALIPVLSSFVVVAASKTYDRRTILFLTPAYLSCLVPALRAARMRAAYAHRLWERHLSALGFAALLVVLAMGYGGETLIYANRLELSGSAIEFRTTFQNITQTVSFSDSPKLGSMQNVTRSVARVLKVSALGTERQQLIENVVYLRGIGFETYYRGHWESSLKSRNFVNKIEPANGDSRIHIARFSADTSVLFLPLNTVDLAILNSTGIFAVDTSQGGAATLASEDTLEYDVSLGMFNKAEGPFNRPPSQEQLFKCREVPPEISPRVRQIASEIASGETRPIDRINKIVNYLRTQHEYDLTFNVGPGDPVSDFILNKKPGHCEYFASAAAIMLRCVDIPTRFVSGYYAHEHDGFSAKVVRRQDAHAWVEAWVEGTGWITVDATPTAGRPDLLAEHISFWRRMWERLQDIARALWGWSGPEVLIGVVAVGFLIASLLYFRWRRIRRRNPPKSRPLYSMPDPALQSLRFRFEKLLERQNLHCPQHLTWAEHLENLATEQDLSFNVTQALQFVVDYNRARFGSTGVGIDDIERSLSMLENHAKHRAS